MSEKKTSSNGHRKLNGKKTVEVPMLLGWLHAQQVAAALGISRQAVTRMMADGSFRTQRGVGDRPLYVVRIEEVEQFKADFEKTKNWRKTTERVASMGPRKIGLDKANA